jgi:hypothetical protein
MEMPEAVGNAAAAAAHAANKLQSTSNIKESFNG